MIPHHRTIHDHRIDPARQRNRILIGRDFVDRLFVKKCQSLRRRLLSITPRSAKTKVHSRQTRHFMHGCFKRKQAQTTTIVAKHAGKRRPQARMWRGVVWQSIRTNHGGRKLHISFVHHLRPYGNKSHQQARDARPLRLASHPFLRRSYRDPDLRMSGKGLDHVTITRAE
jgi:hypothetical protein